MTIDKRISEKLCRLRTFGESTFDDVDNFYSQNFVMHFATKMPYVSNDNVILAKSSILKDKEIACNYIINGCIERLDLGNKIFTGKQEIEKFFLRIIGAVQKEFYELVFHNPIEYTLILYQMLDYCFHLTTPIISSVNDTLDSSVVKDETIRNISRSIELSKLVAKTGNNQKSFSKQLHEVEGVLASDKSAIQKGINFIEQFCPNKTVQDLDININCKDALNYSRALYHLYQIRDIARYQKYKGFVRIENNEIFIEKVDLDNNEIFENIYDMLKSRTGSEYEDFEFSQEVNNVCKGYIGVTIDEIYKIIKFIRPSAELVFHYGSFDMISKVISDAANIFIEDSDKLTSYLSGLGQEGFVESTSLDNSRALRNCFVKIDLETELYCYTIKVFIFSLFLLLNDIKSSSTGIKEFNDELFKYTNKIHLKFEDDLKVFLEKEFPDCISKSNVEKDGGIKNVKLPGQIDLLFNYKRQLFVFECKAFDLKFTPKSTFNEMAKLSSTIQKKLGNKIKTIKENLESVKTEMGIEEEIEGVFGAIITKNVSNGSLLTDVKFPILHFSVLKNWVLSHEVKE